MLSTPVAYLADYLRKGHLTLKKGNLVSLKSLGAFKSIFDDLGGIRSELIYKRDRFLIEEVAQILKRKDCSDKKSLESVRYFMQNEGTYELKITILCEKDYIVMDGNKRATAFYENKKNAMANNINLSVFLLGKTFKTY